MTNQEKMDLLIQVFNVIFQSKAGNTNITTSYVQSPHINNIVGIISGRCFGRWFVNGTLRGFDIDINTGIRILPLRCLEQNPNKHDNKGNLTWSAALAQQGHLLMWVIDRSPGGEFLGRLQKDVGKEPIVWYKAFEPATRPATPDHGAYAQPLVNSDFHGTPITREAVHNYNPPQPNLSQPSVVALPELINISELPELPPEVDIPDYILEAVAEMDEPPDWGEDYD